MFRYQNNAFRILGLKPNVSMKEITKRVNEIKVKISLGMNVEYDYDFPFMGPIHRDEQNILNALQRLENPISRLREEIFWFWIETENDNKAINCIIHKQHKVANNIWKNQIAEGNITENSISAYFNQIILLHSSVIREENAVYQESKETTHKKKNISLSENHWNNWRIVIDRLILLDKNNIFWDMIQKKVERIDDPRLSKIKVNEIRNNFLNDIVQPNFSLISQALNKKEYSTIKGHLNLFTNDSWVPGDLKFPIELLKKGFNKILSTHISLLDNYTRNAERGFRKIEKDKEDLDKLVVSIIELYYRLVKDAANIIFEGDLVDLNNISDFSLAKDKTAEIIRVCAVVLFNSLIDNQSYKDRQDKLFKSYIMIRKAFEYSGTYRSRQKIEKDEEAIKRYLEYTFGIYNFTNILNNVQKNENNQEGLGKNIKEEKKPSKTDWASTLIYGALGVLILLIIIYSDFSNKSPINTTNTSSPIASSSSNSLYNNDLNQLEITIDNLEEELTIKERRLEEMVSTLETSYAKISNFEIKLEDLDSKINNTYLQNDKNRLIDEYNQIYEHYDKLYSSYEDTYLEYEKLYEEYETLHNALIDYHNSGTIPWSLMPWSFIQKMLSENEKEFIIYTVKAGDSLSRIAKNFNTTIEIIAEKNNLINLNVIRPGQKLIIPQ